MSNLATTDGWRLVGDHVTAPDGRIMPAPYPWRHGLTMADYVRMRAGLEAFLRVRDGGLLRRLFPDRADLALAGDAIDILVRGVMSMADEEVAAAEREWNRGER